ncbi:hypothetical protein OHR68_33390 [Spirillospora sp. NBC_00431]
MAGSDGFEIFPVAIGAYADPDLPDLDVDTEVARIVEILADFGGRGVPWDVPMADRGRDAVHERLHAWTASSEQRSVLYWVGHGWSKHSAAALATGRSPQQVGADGVPPQLLAERIAGREHGADDDSWLIVIIDACQSTRFVELLNAELDTLHSPRRVLLVGTSGPGATRLGVFSAVLRSIVTNTFAANPEIPLWDFARELMRGLPGAAVCPRQIHHGVLRRRVPQPVTGVPLDVFGELNTVLDSLSDDERRHFVPRAQGGELGEQAWYFQGRDRQRRAVVDWLADHESGLLVVTGAAGAGKSALLGHLVVQSRPELAQALIRHRLIPPVPDRERPPDHAFTVVVHLVGMTGDELIDHIAAQLRIGEVPMAGGTAVRLEWLLERLAARGPVTILLDALDEAVDPLGTTAPIVRALGAQTGVRVVVGTRGSTGEALDDHDPADRDLLDALDAQATDIVVVDHDPSAVARYVAGRLTARRDALGLTDDAINAAAVTIGAANRGFLFARLLVHEVVARPELLTANDLDAILRTDHRHLFTLAVARILTRMPGAAPCLEALALSRGRGLPISDEVWSTVATAIDFEDVGAVRPGEVLAAAAPYIAVDREHGQTVYRLAHRTFVEHFTATATAAASAEHRHRREEAITVALLERGRRDGWSSASPYSRSSLPEHAAAAGMIDELLADDEYLLHADLRKLTPLAGHANTAAGNDRARLLRLTPHAVDAPPAARASMFDVTQALEQQRQRLSIGMGSAPYRVRWSHSAARTEWAVLDGHQGGATTVCSLTVDGRPLVASGGADGLLKVWDPDAGHQLSAMSGHSAAITDSCSFVLNGQSMVATSADDGTVRIWDLVAQRVVRVLTGHVGPVVSVCAVAADGRQLLTSLGGRQDHNLRIWDPSTGRLLHQMTPDASANVVRSVRFRGNTFVATGADGQFPVQLWDPATGRQRVGLYSHINGSTDDLSSFTDGSDRWLVTNGGAQARGVEVWDPTGGRHYTAFRHAGRMTCSTVVESAGRYLLCGGGSDGTVRIADLQTGDLIRKLDHGPGGVDALCHWQDGATTLLATAGADGVVRIWDIATGTQRLVIADVSRLVRAMRAVTVGDQTWLATSGGVMQHEGTVRIWDTVTAELRQQMNTAHAVEVMTGLSQHHDAILATGGPDGVVRLWDVSANRLVREFTAHAGPGVRSLHAFETDGAVMLATAGFAEDTAWISDDTVLIWDPSTGRQRHTWEARERAVIGSVVEDGQARLLLKGAGRMSLVDPRSGLTTRDLDPAGSSAATATVFWQGGDPRDPHPYDSGASTLCVVKHGTGEVLVSGGDDGTIRIWDTASRTELHRVTRNGRRIHRVAAFGDRPLVACLEEGGHVTVLNVSTGAVIHELELNVWSGQICPFVSDGYLKLATASSSRDGMVTIWDVAGGRSERSLSGHPGKLHDICVLIGDQGPLLATAGDDPVVRIWDPATGSVVRELAGHGGFLGVSAVAAVTVGDRHLLATADSDTVRIWDPVTGGELRRPEPPVGFVVRLTALRHYGRTFLAAVERHFGDSSVRLWDATSGKQFRTLEGSAVNVRGICGFDLEGRPMVATVENVIYPSGPPHDGYHLRIWNGTTGFLEQAGTVKGTKATAVCAFSDGARALLATAEDAGYTRIWDPGSGEHMRALHGHTGRGGIRAVCTIDRAGPTLLATAGQDGTVRIWDPATGSAERADGGAIYAVCMVRHGGHTLIAGADGHTIRLWNAATGRQERVLEGHLGLVQEMCTVTTDEHTFLASASNDNTVRIWNLDTGHVRHVLRHHAEVIAGVRPLRIDGRQLLVSGAADRTVRVWDPVTGHEVHSLHDEQWVFAIRVLDSGEQTLLVSAGANDALLIRDARTGRLQHHVILPTGWTNHLSAIPTPDQTLLATASQRDDSDHVPRIWDVASGDQVHALSHHTGGVSAIGTVPAAGRPLLVTADGRGTLHVWDPVTGQQLHEMPGHTGPVRAMTTMPMSGRTLLATSSSDRTVRLWNPVTGTPLLTIPVHHAAGPLLWTGESLAIGHAKGLLVLHRFDLAAVDPKI